MRCQVIFTNPETKEWLVNDIKSTDEIGEHFGLSDVDMDRMDAAIVRGEYFTLPRAGFAAYPMDARPGDVPEVITGLDQFRAGHGRFVTDWCATRELAVAEFHRMRDAVIRVHCLAEVTARREWACGVTEAWRAKASTVLLNLVNTALTVPIEAQANVMFEYWRFRSQPTASGRIVDPHMRRQWDAVLAGHPIKGNCNHYQALQSAR